MLPPYNAGAAKSGAMVMLDPNLAKDGKTHQGVELTREELDKLAFWLDMLVPAFGDYAEGGAWDDNDWKKFAYYEQKKQDMQDLDALNNLQFISWQREGALPPLPSDPNTYRNLAQNWDANQVNFGRPIKTDQVVITVGPDFPHGTYECTIECSNGFTRAISLQKTAERQVFTFPVQSNVTWLKLTDPPAGFRKVEVFGIDDL